MTGIVIDEGFSRVPTQTIAVGSWSSVCIEEEVISVTLSAYAEADAGGSIAILGVKGGLGGCSTV